MSSTNDFYRVNSTVDNSVTMPVDHSKSQADATSPTDKLRADSDASPAQTRRQQDHIKPASMDVTAHGFPDTQLDNYIAREQAEQRRKSGPGWSGPSYITDPVFEKLNTPLVVPGKLGEREQKIAERLTSAVEADRAAETKSEKDGRDLTQDANKKARGQLADVVSAIDGSTMSKILPTVNSQLAHSDLNPPVKLASIDVFSHSYHELFLGAKTPESKQNYAVGYSVGMEKKDPPSFLELAFPGWLP